MSGKLAKTFSLLPMVLVVSLGANVLQARKIFELVDPSIPHQSRVGTAVGPIAVHAASGAVQTVRFDEGRPTLLYYFSPTCAWCERNWGNVDALADAAKGRFRVIAVAGEADLRAFRENHPLRNVEVFGGLSVADQGRLALTGTPHTLVLSAQGIVSHDWAGAFQGKAARELEELFDITLPGVLPRSTSAPSR